MLQRIQTIWLLLAAIGGSLTFKYAFFSGNLLDEHQVKAFKDLTAGAYLPILLLTILCILLSVIAIGLFKNRRLQLRLTLGALVLSILIIVLYYIQAKKFEEGAYDLTALFAIAVPVLLLLAARGISKDEKLVKSLDRLR